MFKTVAAFATGDGGIMVFGIDPDELTVTGLDGEDPKKLRDRLHGLVHRTVVPSPDVTVEDHQVDGETILVLYVAPRPAPPYGSPRQRLPEQARVLRAQGLKYLPCPARRTTRSSPHPHST
jgi:predicted HTH transcriptional regulator